MNADYADFQRPFTTETSLDSARDRLAAEENVSINQNPKPTVYRGGRRGRRENAGHKSQNASSSRAKSRDHALESPHSHVPSGGSSSSNSCLMRSRREGSFAFW